MINKQTVFIIGAGSGFDIKMPLGVGLAATISNLTKITIEHNRSGSSDPNMAEILSHLARQESSFNSYEPLLRLQAASREISQGINLCDSIDDYVDIHQSDRDIVKIAKIAISRSILKAEQQSKLHNEKNGLKYIDFTAMGDVWYTRLFKIITQGVSKENASSAFDNIVFINFNYDRCLEHYLVLAMSQLYTMKAEDATSIVSKIKIYHPYGQVGYLPGFGNMNVYTPFGGSQHDKLEPLRISDEIVTYAENISDLELNEKIKDSITEAEQLIFLGFGFHEQNIKILDPGRKSPHPKTVFATAMGISSPNWRIIQSRLAHKIVNHSPGVDKDSIHMDPSLDCKGLLNEFALRIRRR